MSTLKVKVKNAKVSPMVQTRDEAKLAFSTRLHGCLDDIGIPKRGRLSRVAEMFHVSVSGARKWLEGESFPDTFRIRDMANAFKVRGEWLLTGDGPKRDLSPVQHRIADAMEMMHMLPDDLAEATGGAVSVETVEGWLDGLAEPTDAELAAIAPHLGRDVAWFADGRVTMRNSMGGNGYDLLDSSNARTKAENLSPVQQRILAALLTAGMQPMDLVEACGGTIAPETVEAWLDGRAEPSRADLDLIAPPLGTTADYLESGAPAAQEGKGGRMVYDTRGEPAPDNLDQDEIDAVRALRRMDGTLRRRILQGINDAGELSRLKLAQKIGRAELENRIRERLPELNALAGHSLGEEELQMLIKIALYLRGGGYGDSPERGAASG